MNILKISIILNNLKNLKKFFCNVYGIFRVLKKYAELFIVNGKRIMASQLQEKAIYHILFESKFIMPSVRYGIFTLNIKLIIF